MQNKGKWLKNRGGHLLGRSFRAPPGGVSYLDSGTLQDTGHLLGGVRVYNGEKKKESENQQWPASSLQ